MARSPAPGGRDRPARPYDPRREERRRLIRLELPDSVAATDLDAEVRQELRGLPKETADLAARHLVMTGRLLDEEPLTALSHARAAGALAGRIGVVREAVGLAAYASEQWALALSELRAARRISGRADHLAVLADCERALGRPDRALSVLSDPDVSTLDPAARVELTIVAAGARHDLGQPEAAVLLLQGPARASVASRPFTGRVWYAYANALLAAGRPDEAREWFARAAEHDGDGVTDAVDRLLELDGIVVQDLLQDDSDGDGTDGTGPGHHPPKYVREGSDEVRGQTAESRAQPGQPSSRRKTLPSATAPAGPSTPEPGDSRGAVPQALAFSTAPVPAVLAPGAPGAPVSAVAFAAPDDQAPAASPDVDDMGGAVSQV